MVLVNDPNPGDQRSPTAAKQPWETPRVVVSTIEENTDETYGGSNDVVPPT